MGRYGPLRMDGFDNRTEPRKKVCIQAFASDLNDTFDIKCIIRDVSKSGCMIVSSNLRELPDLVQLVPEGFERPMNAKIAWRKGKMAGLSFLADDDEDVATRAREFFHHKVKDLDEDEALNLKAFLRPLGYADRLARLDSRNR